MKKKRFSVEQIVSVLKQAELGVPVAEVIRKVGISEQTFYRWKKQYVGMETDQARQMGQNIQEWLCGDETGYSISRITKGDGIPVPTHVGLSGPYASYR